MSSKKVTVRAGYEWLKTLEKGAKALVYYGFPLVVGWVTQFHPEVLSITVGTLFIMIENWAKNSVK